MITNDIYQLLIIGVNPLEQKLKILLVIKFPGQEPGTQETQYNN